MLVLFGVSVLYFLSYMQFVHVIFATLGFLGLVACQGSKLPEQTAVSLPSATPLPTPQIGVSFVTRAIPTTAVLQITPTPLPTATATPTATPVVVQIASGDTILGIAIQRGTTVEDILLLNPGIVPENLQIGQSIILPPPATAVALAAQGTAVPLQVTVSKIHAYQTPIGGLWLLGEVINEGRDPVENIQVEIGLLAADGRSLGSTTAWVATSIILPGERGPFAVLIDEPPADFAQPAVSVVGGQHLVELGTRYLDVLLLNSEIELKDSGAVLSGLVRNDGAEVASSVQIIATFYDEQGSVTGFQQEIVAGRLAVGEERPFRLESTPLGGQTASYTLSIEAFRDN